MTRSRRAPMVPYYDVEKRSTNADSLSFKRAQTSSWFMSRPRLDVVGNSFFATVPGVSMPPLRSAFPTREYVSSGSSSSASISSARKRRRHLGHPRRQPHRRRTHRPNRPTHNHQHPEQRTTSARDAHTSTNTDALHQLQEEKARLKAQLDMQQALHTRDAQHHQDKLAQKDVIITALQTAIRAPEAPRAHVDTTTTTEPAFVPTAEQPSSESAQRGFTAKVKRLFPS